MRTTLVAQLNTRPPENVSDRLRLAALSLGTDAALVPTDLVVSAYEAMRLGDLTLSEQLARGALVRGGGLAARLPLAHSLAWQGRGREADDVLAAVDPDTLSQWDLMAWALPKAANLFWMLAESQAAVDLLARVRTRITEPAARDAAAIAERSGQWAIALRATHDGVRLGDTRLADQVARIGRQLDCALAPLVYAHARHLADGDAAGLDAVAAAFASHQLNLAGADAASQAAALHGSAGTRTLELESRNRAAQLAARCDAPSTPALERVLNPLPLTDRELEVGVMVAEGLTNKAIADRLSVSVRTVEGHIYRACIKLDVPDRAMLATAITATRVVPG